MITRNNLIAHVLLSEHRGARAEESQWRKLREYKSCKLSLFSVLSFFFVVGAYGACVTKCCMEIRSTNERGVMRLKRRRSPSTRTDDRSVSLMQTVFLSLRSAECLPASLTPVPCGAKTFWFPLIIRVFSRFSMNRKFHLALNNNWSDAPSSTYCRCCARITSLFLSFANGYILVCGGSIYSFNYALSARPSK